MRGQRQRPQTVPVSSRSGYDSNRRTSFQSLGGQVIVPSGCGGPGLVSHARRSLRISRDLPSVPSAIVGPRKSVIVGTKEEVWEVYELFAKMDKQGRRAVSRADFLAAMRGEPSVEFTRLMRRAALVARFRDSARDMHLDELVRLVWPRASDQEVKQMMIQAQLKEIADAYRAKKVGDKEELEALFRLLDQDGSGTVTREEIMRTGLFTQAEVREMLGADDGVLSEAEMCNRGVMRMDTNAYLRHGMFGRSERPSVEMQPPLGEAAVAGHCASESARRPRKGQLRAAARE